MKRFLFVFLLISFLNAETQEWKLIGVSGNSYSIECVNDGEKGVFVPAYQVWKNLNLTRSSLGDTISVRYGKNEVRMFRNSDKYFFNEVQKNFNKSTFYQNGSTYCDIVSFCDVMNDLTGLYFDCNIPTKEIRVSRNKKVNDAVSVADNSNSNNNISGIIVIDPGHGGRDPGAIGPGGVEEKDVVLTISLELKKYLSKYKNIKVYLTRETDVFVPLRERTHFANSKSADLFVSVHANASRKNTNVGGYKMYFLSEAKNESDESTARLENSVLELEGESQLTGLESILLSLANSEYIKESQEFAIMLEKSFEKNMKDIQKLHTGVGQANFFVLNGASMPAVLVETAFISNPREEKLLADKKFQKNSGESIGAAIIEFLRKYPSEAR